MTSVAQQSPDSTLLTMTSTFPNKTLTLLTLATTANSTVTLSGPTLTPEEQVTIDRYMAVLRGMEHSYMWVIFALGFPGNTCSLLVILGMRWWGSPALFMATLAVVDNLAIVVKLMLVQFGQHRIAIGEAGCKLMFFLGNHLVVYANWVLVAMAVERFFAVWQPLKVTQLWTPRKAAVSLALLLLLTIGLTSPLFFTVTVKVKHGVQMCGVHADYASFMRIWQSSQVIAYGFLPCLLLTTINVLIIILISRAHRLHRTLTTTTSTTSSKQSSNASGTGGHHTTHHPTSSASSIQRQATIMLVVTSAMLVLTTTPICVYMLLLKKWDPPRGSPEHAKKEFISSLLRVICDTNHSVNFYLYFVSARKFRSYFCKALCFLCSRFLKRRGSEGAYDRRFSAIRSTLRVKGTGSEGHTMVFERKLVEEEGGVVENGIPLQLFGEGGGEGQEGGDRSSSGALL